MVNDDAENGSTPQIEAPRTTEQLVAGATSAHDIGYGRRSARGHGYELRGLSYVPGPGFTRALRAHVPVAAVRPVRRADR